MGTSVFPCELHLLYLSVSVPLTWWLGQHVLVLSSLGQGGERPVWIQQITMAFTPPIPPDESHIHSRAHVQDILHIIPSTN